MEKFSKFNDPFTGINPFVQGKLRSYSIFKCLIFYPIYLLSKLHPIFFKLLFSIKISGKINQQPKTMICNSASTFDIPILKYILGIKNFYFLRCGNFYDKNQFLIKRITKPCIVFVEGTSTNNKSILNYNCNFKIDSVCCIKYTEVYCYGSYIRYLASLLSNENKIEINFKQTQDPKDLIKISNLKQVKFTYKDKEEFNKLLK